MKSKTVNELLADPENQTKVDNWLEWVKTTEQPEFKGQYDSTEKNINDAKKSNAHITQLQGGALQSVLYQLIAQTYGTPCTQAQEKAKE